jgi:predicted metal-binding protein
MQTYIELALEMKMLHARLITPEDMVFDIRTLLKCRWGCENHDNKSFKCRERRTSFEERLQMIKADKNILFIHSHDGGDVSRACLEIERRAFLDGNPLAFAVRYCNLCKKCAVDENLPCVQPEKVRPCEALFGIDVYATAKRHGLPCYPLQHKDEVQNRYGFVCIS